MNYQKYIKKAKEIYKNEPTGHDFSHIERVVNFCYKILAKEGGNEFIVIISALFHDVHRVLSSKNNKFISAKEAMPEIQSILNEFKIEQSLLQQILFIIENHDNKKINIQMPLELQIVQDADILDALGEIGLNRTLTYCKKNNIPVVDLNFPLDCKEYIPDINPISTCHYIYRTMIPNVELLHTKTAKILAQYQVEILHNFIKSKLNQKNP